MDTTPTTPTPTPAPAPAPNPWREVEDDYFDSPRSRNDPEFDGDRW
jgi:hypothetical protein